MRRIALWSAIGAAGLVAVALLGALVVDAPMPGRPPSSGAVDCGDAEAVARADDQRERQARLGVRTVATGC